AQMNYYALARIYEGLKRDFVHFAVHQDFGLPAQEKVQKCLYYWQKVEELKTKKDINEKLEDSFTLIINAVDALVKKAEIHWHDLIYREFAASLKTVLRSSAIQTTVLARKQHLFGLYEMNKERLLREVEALFQDAERPIPHRGMLDIILT